MASAPQPSGRRAPKPGFKHTTGGITTRLGLTKPKSTGNRGGKK